MAFPSDNKGIRFKILKLRVGDPELNFISSVLFHYTKYRCCLIFVGNETFITNGV
jgi:hypothetical protein